MNLWIYTDSFLPFKGWTFEITDWVVLACHDCPKRSRWLKVHWIYGLWDAHNFTDTRATVRHEHVSKLFTSLASNQKSLIITWPGEVLHGSRNWLELIFQNVLFVNSVPDSYFSFFITRRNIKPRRRVLSAKDVRRVFCVDISSQVWISDVSDEDTVAIHV